MNAKFECWTEFNNCMHICSCNKNHASFMQKLPTFGPEKTYLWQRCLIWAVTLQFIKTDNLSVRKKLSRQRQTRIVLCHWPRQNLGCRRHFHNLEKFIHKSRGLLEPLSCLLDSAQKLTSAFLELSGTQQVISVNFHSKSCKFH